MSYSRFEWMTIAIGTAAVLGTLALSLGTIIVWSEVAAQVLLLFVLVGAVHWGRRGGLVAALAATLAYIVLRLPEAGGTPTLYSGLAGLVLIRAATYGIIGIIGGEICGRVKYGLAKLEEAANIDDASGVYTQAFAVRLLARTIAKSVRYNNEFSVGLLAVSSAVTDGLRPEKALSLTRAVADHIRNGLRLIDDVGHLDDGSYLLLLGNTPKAGAVSAIERVRTGVRDLLGAKNESVTSKVYGSREDMSDIQALADRLTPAPEENPATGAAVPETA